MDLELKPEFQGATLRGRCFPMSSVDKEEIERQVQELVQAGLVEEYTGTEYPQFCSPTYLRENKKK